jgi:hypothetical protein
LIAPFPYSLRLDTLLSVLGKERSSLEPMALYFDRFSAGLIKDRKFPAENPAHRELMPERQTVPGRQRAENLGGN